MERNFIHDLGYLSGGAVQVINSITKLITWSFLLIILAVMALPIFIDTQITKHREREHGG